MFEDVWGTQFQPKEKWSWSVDDDFAKTFGKKSNVALLMKSAIFPYQVVLELLKI